MLYDIQNLKLTSFEWTAESEGISSHVSGAGADRSESSEVAVSVHTTHSIAWVNTRVVDTCWLVAGAFTVGFTLGGTDPVRISMITLLKLIIIIIIIMITQPLTAA